MAMFLFRICWLYASSIRSHFIKSLHELFVDRWFIIDLFGLRISGWFLVSYMCIGNCVLFQYYWIDAVERIHFNKNIHYWPCCCMSAAWVFVTQINRFLRTSFLYILNMRWGSECYTHILYSCVDVSISYFRVTSSHEFCNKNSHRQK